MYFIFFLSYTHHVCLSDTAFSLSWKLTNAGIIQIDTINISNYGVDVSNCVWPQIHPIIWHATIYVLGHGGRTYHVYDQCVLFWNSYAYFATLNDVFLHHAYYNILACKASYAGYHVHVHWPVAWSRSCCYSRAAAHWASYIKMSYNWATRRNLL